MKFLVSIALTMLSAAACVGSVCNPDEETQTVGDKVVEVPTYDTGKTDPNLMFRVKLSTLTQGAYEGCVTPKLESAKVYVPILP